MIIEVNDKFEFVLKKVFKMVHLETEKEKFGICMRDTGFEFQYGNKWYSAQNGRIQELVSSMPNTGGIASCPICNKPY